MTPLKNLTNLDYLNLESNQISDVTPLKNLTNLKHLTLWYNQISDVTPLRNLTNLEWLELSRNQISDVTPLTNMTNMETLNLWGNQISDVTPLKNMTKLETLNLSVNPISDLTPLKNMTKLETLIFEGNPISDLTPLRNLTNLNNLDLLKTQISDVTPLKNMTKLETLNLQGNPISDLTPLKNMTKLETLDLSDTQISDVTPLTNMTKLKNLFLGDNHITDLSPLSKLPAPQDINNGNWQMHGQTLTSTVKSGTTVSLPSVINFSWDDPVSWSVYKGDVSINASKSTVTYNSPGEVVLQWHGATIEDSFEDSADSCVAGGGVWTGLSGGDGPCAWYVFSGTMTVTVKGCQGFTDVPTTHTFYNAICWVRETGITMGTGDGSTYSPSNPVNRGSMAAFLYRLAGSPKWDPPKISPFVDVKTTDTFYPAITWLYSQGVTVGTTVNGKVYYQPTNAVNRGSMSAFLYRFSASPKWTLPTSSPFADVTQTNTFYKSITWLADQKITVGSTSGGKLVYQPGNPVNRGSMAAFMQRLAKTELQCTRYPTAVGC